MSTDCRQRPQELTVGGLSACERAMKVVGRAETLDDLVNMVLSVGERTEGWARLTAWLNDELRFLRLECDLVEKEFMEPDSGK